jgi:hypothetical protein
MHKTIFALAFACAQTAFAQTRKPTPTAPAKTTAPTPPAKPDVARNWLANAKRLDGRPAATFVSEVGDAGVFTSDVAYAVVPITTATQGDAAGGEILLLLPPAEVQKTVTALLPVAAAKKSNFGAKRTLRRLDGTLRIVGGELVLVKGGDVAELKKFGKPSAVLAAQLKAAAALDAAASQAESAERKQGKQK